MSYECILEKINRINALAKRSMWYILQDEYFYQYRVLQVELFADYLWITTRRVSAITASRKTFQLRLHVTELSRLFPKG